MYHEYRKRAVSHPKRIGFVVKVYEKVRVMRELKKWSQEEMATQLSMSTGGYAKIERGETRLNLPRLEQIAEVLEIDICELLQGLEGNVVYQVNEGENNSNVSYGNGDEHLQMEIEKLKLIIEHKDELLQTQQREIETLKEMIELLKAKSL